MPIQNLSPEKVQEVWEKAQKKLKGQLSPAAFTTWISTNPLTSIQLLDQSKAVGTISTPTAFHATNLKKNLYSQIKTSIEQVLNKQLDLKFKVQNPADLIAQQKQMSSKQKKQGWSKSSFNLKNNQAASLGQNESQSPLVEELFSSQNIQSAQQDQALTAAKRAGLRLDYKFQSFAVSSSNELAHAAATAVSKRPGQAYNPLFLYGGVGVGKTHLMQAIGHAILERNPGKNLLYCTGEEFTNEIIEAIKTKKAIKFKKKYRNTSVLLIDDIQFIAGKNAVQEEFFHTFNALIKNSAQIVLTSDKPPQEINPLEDRLKSRFETGLMIDIQQPSLQLKTAIVLIKARSNNISLPINLAEKIASRAGGARKIEGIITSLRSSVELRHLDVDEELINTIIERETPQFSPKIRLKPQKIIKKVCSFYQVNPSVIKGKRRNKEYVKARHLAMHLLKCELDMSYVEIGRWFSNRDHTSVMHAKNKIDRLIKTNDLIREDYAIIKKSLLKMSN
ncbi:MAG: chromosomal replication initiator protein DnaA [Patescibacteria group bacterium]|nr:chromosomal replication initiator protein DnaA [Patescibacteria group bacterium]